MTELLSVQDLRTTYPTRRTFTDRLARRPREVVRAVDGVSLSVAKGEMLAIVGESGCGKTTTLQSILGMVPTAAGSVLINGTDVTHLTSRQMRPLRRHVQMIYQDPYESLDVRFKVRQTVEEPLLVHKIGASKAERAQLVRAAMVRAELTPPEAYLERFPHQLSGGQRQRVAIAASLVLEPELLLADEPVSMLDVSVRAGVLSLLDRLRRGGSMGIVMITHDLSTAAHFADRIAVMYLGRIVEQGPARDVIHRPQHPYTKALLSIVPRPDPRERSTGTILSGETPNPRNIPGGCRFHPRCPVAEDRCRGTDPALAPPARPVEGTDPEHLSACLLA
jgi:oligopeptide/dipeptide ABC transporter ATP-binding protein